ncbi:hypothetical protein A2cp1_0024 [Anaeromyxobacter dehalogenans 2CP-1]|uniref:Uncharacterized protein n=1 Tax=Anaeromyxobacter dehalogenans (strain ATCC BAA-258 / DSM 21875 / 2CP-1) TaxID=455488 RepID=B8J704_ANAD2|nr:hypothetical protein [Anaeromyxobacter dehalogenans]ACL63385.1 hypothetical protein A2cp1_0024 [Anaeromyxobacter dehalogenans 2CP-1]
MATWTIRIDAEEVSVTYREGDKVQHCGNSERVLEAEVVGWVHSEADAFDRLVTPSGIFVRQVEPAGGARS